MKKSLSLFLALVMIFSVFSLSVTANAESVGILGDADGDGKVTANDALLILRIAAGIEDYTQDVLTRCDVNEDGYLTIFDARKILRCAAGLVSLEQTGLFKGFNGNGVFATEEELLTYFNKNINRIKSERFGFNILKDVEMNTFTMDSATFLGVSTENTDALIQEIFATANSDADEEGYVVYGNSSTNKISVEGKTYVSTLSLADVYGAKAVADQSRGVVTITIALPDCEKSEINDSPYIKVFNTQNLLGATETTLNSILTGISEGTEVVHYKNAYVEAEFEIATGNVTEYNTYYETKVFITSAQNGLITLKGVNYETANKAYYTDFVHE